ERGRRVVAEAPGEGKRVTLASDSLEAQAPRALGSGDRRVGLPVNGNPALYLQQIARGEIDEQQAGARVAQKVAERVEVTVAAETRHHQGVGAEVDEAGPAAAVGDVEAAVRRVGARATGDEESVGGGDQPPRVIIELGEVFGSAGTRHTRRWPAGL